MSDRLLKESDVLKIAFQLPLVVNSAFADAVKALPFVDIEVIEPKRGEWIEINIKDYKAKCSCCGTWSPIMGRYCPNCGADMRKESE